MPIWANAIFYGIVGAAAGGLVALVTRGRSFTRYATSAAVILSVLLVRQFAQGWLNETYADLTATTPFEKYNRALARKLSETPAVLAWAKTAGAATSSQATASGMKRLPADLLMRRVELVSKMLNNSPDDACEALASGTPSTSLMEVSLSQLSEPELREFAVIVGAAMAAEQGNSPVLHLPPTNEDVEKYLMPLVRDLDGEDLKRVSQALLGGATPRDACWGRRLIFRRAAAASGGTKTVVAVMLALD
jgi:hypothetical protein